MRLLASVLLLVASAGCSPDDVQPSTITDGAVVDAWLQTVVDEGRLIGASAIVFQGSRETYYGSAGFADVADGRPIERDDIFRIYSMTKPVTGVALMTLYEDGLFELDDPLATYVPEMADVQVFDGLDEDGNLILVDPVREITVLDILRHTAGMPSGPEDGPEELQAVYYTAGPAYMGATSLEELAVVLGSIPLFYHPGTQWRYSDAVELQALMVERLSGKPFDAYLQETVFDPLGMTDTSHFVPTSKLHRLAELYTQNEGGQLVVHPGAKLKDVATERQTLNRGGSGLYSTIDDFARFARMLLNEGSLDGVEILTPETVRLMATNHLPDDLDDQHFLPMSGAVGFGIDFAVRYGPPESDGWPYGVVGEFYWGGAAGTDFFIDPENELFAILMTQRLPFDGTLLKGFRDAVYNKMERTAPREEPSASESAVQVTANLRVRHSIGGIDEFERNKFITIHSHQTVPEWDSTETLDYVIKELDVHLGRDNETGNRDLHLIPEDPERPGFPDISVMKENGLKSRQWYNEQTHLHDYEANNEPIVATHVYPLFPKGRATNAGWVPANSHATGEFLGHHIKEYYGDADGIHGEPTPMFLEVVNEPMWHLVTTSDDSTPREIFEHHNIVAEEVRKIVPDVQVGGYCAAFPNFEEDDFQRWHDRDKLFYDMSGEHMDFITIHVYDFPVFSGKEQYRRGGNLEATLDMMEQYSHMTLGKVLPIMVTEYGAQTHDLRHYENLPLRDWLIMKASMSQTLQFMERPDRIVKVIPFFILSDYWGGTKDRTAHSIRSRNSEGVWNEYTHQIKYYQFWKDVRGKRVLVESDNLDVQTQGFVDGNVFYLVLDNLEDRPQPIDLNILGGGELKRVSARQLHLVASAPALDEHDTAPDKFVLDNYGTAVLRYEFAEPIKFDLVANEKTYYATSYLQPIQANERAEFSVVGVPSSVDKAILRVGLGRDHGKSLAPKIHFNGTAINVPDNWRGDDQRQRDTFFGLLEIPVPAELVAKDNTIEIEFRDSGGHLSTVTLEVTNLAAR